MKKFLSLVLALAMTMSLVTISAGAKDFTDADDITYVEAVEVMTAIGVVSGDTAGNFNATAGLTRGAAAKIICNLILGPTTAAALNADANPYVDVDKNSTFAGYIAFCAKEGIISGYADGTFKPAAPLTGYAFMKMLLGALGYDKSVEGYEGGNWSINVAKRALNIGLDDGLVDTFNGSDYVTREEAMLYAFNALLSDMVTYDTTITIGDVTIAGSKAEVMENKGKTDGNIDRDGVMQFAEKYFTNLKGYGDTDAFMRPANTWKIKSETVGTYTETPDLTYTAEVKTGTIYSDLGLSKGIDDSKVSWYVDGTNNSTSWTWDVVKGDVTNKIGGNGTVTDVYYDADAGTITVVQVNTYVAEIAAAFKATTTKDAYVTLNAKTGSGTTYETDDAYAKEDIVIYTYSNKSDDRGVQSMALAEKVSGALSAYTTEKNVTVDGTVYAKSAAGYSIASLNNAVGKDVAVYLDEYGYAVYVDADQTAQYAVLLDYAAGARLESARAKLLFTDGTTKKVDVKALYKENGTATSYVSTFASADDDVGVYDIVKYTVNSDDEYSLTLAGDSEKVTEGGERITNGSPTMKLMPGNSYNVSNSGALIANGKTIFLVMDDTGTTTTYTAYTGIANVPTVTLAGGTYNTPAAVISENGATAKIVFVAKLNTKVSINDQNKDVTFIKGSSVAQSYTKDLGYYYEYDAVINGVEGKIKTEAAVSNYALVSGIAYNSKGIATGWNDYAELKTSDNTVIHNGTNVLTGVGTIAEENEVIGLAGRYYAYADDCKVYYINTAGELSEATATSIADDTTDQVWFKLTDGAVSTVFIKVVDTNTTVTPASGSLASVAVSNDSTTGGLVVDVTLTANVAALTNTTATVEKYMEATDKWVTVASGVTVGIGAGYNHSGDVIVLADAAVVAGATYRVTITLDGASITSANYTSV